MTHPGESVMDRPIRKPRRSKAERERDELLALLYDIEQRLADIEGMLRLLTRGMLDVA